MSKKTKKDTTPLKFDISSENLKCFLLAKSTSKLSLTHQSPPRNRIKRKTKPDKAKHIEFQ